MEQHAQHRSRVARYAASIAITLAAGPVLAVVLILAIYLWFVLFEQIDIGTPNPWALLDAYKASILPALLCGCALAALDRTTSRMIVALPLSAAVGFLATGVGMMLQFGIGDPRALALVSCLGIIPAMGCQLLWRRVAVGRNLGR